MPNRKSLWIGHTLVLLSAVMFSAKAIFVKLAYADASAHGFDIDPVTLLTMRMGLALPMFIAIAIWSNRHAPTRLQRRDWQKLVFFGLIGYYGSSLLDFMGLQYVSASLERLILFLNPTMVIMISALVLGYRIVRTDIVSLVLSYAGIALVVVSDWRINPHGTLLGGALVLGSAIMYAGYLAGGGQMIKRVGSVRFAAIAFVISTIGMFVHFALARDWHVLEIQSARIWTLSAWMAVVSTVVPILMMAEGMRRVGATDAAMLSSIGPIATIFLGAIFLGEPITVIQLIGAALVVAGVLMISLRKA